MSTVAVPESPFITLKIKILLFCAEMEKSEDTSIRDKAKLALNAILQNIQALEVSFASKVLNAFRDVAGEQVPGENLPIFAPHIFRSARSVPRDALAWDLHRCVAFLPPPSIAHSATRYPVGIWKPTWAAGVATSAVMEVLVNEKLGFLTASGGGSATVDGFFAIAGCETPNDMADRRCGSKTTYYHVHLEGWTAGYPITWKQIQDDYPDTAPEIVGSMGYQGLSGRMTWETRKPMGNPWCQETTI
eukprot:s1824_g7.t1